MDDETLIQKLKSLFPDCQGLDTDIISYLSDLTVYLDLLKTSVERERATLQLCLFLNELYGSNDVFSDHSVREQILEYYAANDDLRELAQRSLQGSARSAFDDALREVEYWQQRNAKK